MTDNQPLPFDSTSTSLIAGEMNDIEEEVVEESVERSVEYADKMFIAFVDMVKEVDLLDQDVVAAHFWHRLTREMFALGMSTQDLIAGVKRQKRNHAKDEKIARYAASLG
jgi:hypothetical protein